MPTENSPGPLILTRPTGDLASGQLRDEMAAALGIPSPYVDVYADRVEVLGEVDDAMTTTAQSVLDNHVPEVEPDAQAEFDAALADAAAKPTVEEKVDALLAALQGTGLPGKAAARGKA